MEEELYSRLRPPKPPDKTDQSATDIDSDLSNDASVLPEENYTNTLSGRNDSESNMISASCGSVDETGPSQIDIAYVMLEYAFSFIDCDLSKANEICSDAYSILNSIEDSGVDFAKINAYDTCCSIFLECKDFVSALECYYTAFIAKDLYELMLYPIHRLQVAPYWIPLLGGLSENKNQQKMIELIRRIRSKVDVFMNSNQSLNCITAIQIYLDIRMSLDAIVSQNVHNKTILKDILRNEIQIARCLLFMEIFEGVCNVCRNIETRFPSTFGHEFIGELFSIWSIALLRLRNFEIAKKKAECYLDLALSEADKDRARCLISEIDKEEEKTLKEESGDVDSDDEYIKGSNYSLLKEQRKKAKAIADQHCKKSKHHRPKRTTEYNFLSETTSWTDIQKSLQKGDTKLQNEQKQIHIPEGHDNSDVETDIEFDNMSRRDWFELNDTSSDDNVDLEINTDVDYYDMSVQKYDNNPEDEFNEHELLQKGLWLSDNFLEGHKQSSRRKSSFPYKDFDSKETIIKLCQQNPLKYKKCTVKLEASHKATCVNLDKSDKITEIEISGRSKIGKVFNEDDVCVEILNLNEIEEFKKKHNKESEFESKSYNSEMNLKVFGQIRGVFRRRHYADIKHPVFVCILDESFHLMVPHSKTVPKLHVLNKNCKKDYQVDVYNYDKELGEFNHSKVVDIKPGEVNDFIFLVAMISWNDLYPRGAVINVINSKDGVHAGMDILRLKHRVPTLYHKETIETVKWLVELEEPLISRKGRKDLNGLDVFTIDSTKTRDLDDALSIEQIPDGCYKVGVHITDVSVFIKKGDAIDKEAYERATTFYPGHGYKAHHMLPEPVSTKFLSLIPEESRPTISVFFTFDENQVLHEHLTKVERTCVTSRQRLSYRETQDIIFDIETNVPKQICEQIQTLFKIAKSQRMKRLGNAMFYVPPQTHSDEDDYIETREAHYLVEEFMVLANHTVGQFLMTKFKDCIPLRIQPSPNIEMVNKWLELNKYNADLVVRLQETRPCPSVRSDLKLAIENAPVKDNTNVMFQHWVWKKLLTAIEKKDFDIVNKIMGCDELHPFSCLVLNEWYELQERGEYMCSGELHSVQDASHFSLRMTHYTNFTSPIRRYVDIITHRLLHCALDKTSPCYTKEEITDMCCHINEVTRRSKQYQKQCRTLNWGYKLQKEPVLVHAFVKSVSDKDVCVVIPGHRNLPKSCITLPLNSLEAVKRPEFKKDTSTGRDILEMTWCKRLYNFKGYAPIIKRKKHNEYRINPHQRGFFQHQRKWKQMLQTLISKDDPKFKKRKLKKIVHNRGLGDCKENTPDMLDNIPCCFNTERDVCSENIEGTITLQSFPFSMTFNHQQILPLQMSAESVNGAFVPHIEIYDQTVNVKHCLVHAKDPVKQLETYSTICSKTRYSSIEDYIRTWKPLVEMEAATNAVKGNTATINDVPVRFLSELEGKFSLGIAFCDQRNIDINKASVNAFLLTKDGNVDDEKDEGIKEIASPDYLCIKCPIFKTKVEDGDLIKGNIDPNNYTIWSAHAKIDRVHVKKSTMHFIFKIHKNSRKVPAELVIEDSTTRCGIEIIQKSSIDRRIDTILQCLNKATPLAKAVALGSEIPKLSDTHFNRGRNTKPDIHYPGMAYNNKQQNKAIKKALQSSFSLIQGPPGTGKTFVGIKLVYLFNQINLNLQRKEDKKKQIIFCGPSNKSVDLVAKWMKRKLGDNCPKFVRWYGSSIEDQEFPIPGKTQSNTHNERAKLDESLREVSMHILIRQPGKPYQKEILHFDRKFKQHRDGVEFVDVTNYRKTISKAVTEEVKNFSVIFCTTAVATNPKVLKGTRGNIFQIIVDECGMCTEPESMAAIIATRAQQIVLIGDHKQLKPILKCSEAAKLGMETSIFERYSGKATMLTSQYRMNPEICSFPSNQFYQGRLETMLSYAWKTDIPLRSWINPDVPVIFCHIAGKEDYLPFDTDEGNENSCSNQDEVNHVVRIFKHLVDEELIETDYINIMSQYNAQCNAIRTALKAEKFININVSTVVASQGGEWDYVILSLVRSLPDYRIEPKPTLGWCKQNLGFITDENQTNVALTRARKGLIVVGNRELMKCSPVWKKFLEHYGSRRCVVDAEDFPPIKKKRRKRKILKKRNCDFN